MTATAIAPEQVRPRKYRQILARGNYIAADPLGRTMPDPNGQRDSNNAVKQIVRDVVYRAGTPNNPTIVESDVDLVADYPEKFQHIFHAGVAEDRQPNETKAAYLSRLKSMIEQAEREAVNESSSAPGPDKTLEAMKTEELVRMAADEEVDISRCKGDRKLIIEALRKAQ